MGNEYAGALAAHRLDNADPASGGHPLGDLPRVPQMTDTPDLLTTPAEYAAFNAQTQIVKIQTDRLLVTIGEVSEMSLFHGPAGVGKSWTMLWVARLLAEQGIRSLYLPTEGASSISRRVAAAEWPPGGMPITGKRYGRSRLTGNSPANLSKVVASLDGLPVQAVILDVASALMVGEGGENSAGEWNDVRDRLSPLTEDRLFLCVHHAGKDPRKGPRGTSRFLDDAAYDFLVSATPDGATIVGPGMKSRGGARERWQMRLVVKDGQVVEQGPKFDTAGGSDPFKGLPGPPAWNA